MSQGAVLVYAEEAETFAAPLRARFPSERLLVVGAADDLDAALAENPEVAFTTKGASLPIESFRTILDTQSLQWFHVGGSGYEHVAGRWDPARVTVTNSTGILAPFLAESCIGAMLALNHGMVAYRDQQKARLWQERYFRPLMGQRLLIVGAGAIGGELATRADALGMEVVAIRRSMSPVPGAREVRPPEALEESLGEADVVSVHLRLTDETRNLFDARLFKLMKRGALFLNTARGGHVVETDLADALRSGHLAGAYLDVFQTEPLPVDSELWDLPTLLISPHASDGVRDWRQRFIGFFADNLARYRAGEPLMNRIG